MERFFKLQDWWGNGITLWVVGFLLLTSPLLLIALKDVSLENDITTWLPGEDPDAQSLEWFSGQFGRDNQLIVSWEGSSLNDPRVEEFAQALQREGPNEIPGIESVSTPRTLIAMMDENNVPQDVAVDRLTGVLIGVGFLKVQFTPTAVEDEEAAKELVRSTTATIVDDEVDVLPPVPSAYAGPVPAIDPDHPDQITEQNDETLFEKIPDHDLQVRWPEMSPDSPVTEEIKTALKSLELNGQPIVEDAFFAPGSPVAISISLKAISDREAAQTVAAIEAVAADQGIPDHDFRIAGSPVSRIRLNQEARRAVWNTDYPAWNLFKRTPVLLSGLVGIVVSFLLLRSLRLSMLVAAASIYTCLAVLALIPLMGQSLNMVLVVLPDLLLVLTTSGAIHVANYWKHAMTLGVENPIATAVKMAWQPCALASVTTAIGMASLMTAVLDPVQQFGFYSSIGCLVSLAMILIGFPSMMSVWPSRRQKFTEHASKEATVWGHLARRLVRRRNLVSLAGLAIFVFCVSGLQWFQTETKVIRYFPKDSRISQDYHYLEEGLSGIVSVDTVIRFDQDAVEKMNISERMELVREAEQKISAHPWISGTLSLADFRDPVKIPSANASTFRRIQYGKTLVRIEKGIFEEQAESASQFTRKATEKLALTTHSGREIRVDDGDEIWRIRAQSIITADVNYSNLTTELENIVQETIAGSSGTDYLVTGMVPLFLRTQQAVLESLIKSFGLAFMIIGVVMMVLLKSPVSGLLAMLPNLFPVGVVFGMVAWMGVPVDMGTMITASVALGIAIDGTLHLLTWYRDGIRNGLSREEAVVLSLQHCGPAMWQTSATIAFAILMVAGADLLLISRFGLLMAGLVMMALVADVILLPALLGGWLGKIIEKNTTVLPPEEREEPETIEFSAGQPDETPEPHRPVRVHSQR